MATKKPTKSTKADFDDGVEVDSAARDWLEKVQKREKEFADGWWKSAESAVAMYDMGKNGVSSDKNPYNILYSNTEVLLPSLYSATAKPDVRARFKGENLKPIPQVAERFLLALTDSAGPGSESLDQAMQENVLSSLTAGMGFVRLRHYAKKAMPLCFEAGYYKGLLWGKARKWSKVPWIAFRHELTKEEIFDQFGIEASEQANYSVEVDTDASGENKDKPNGSIVYEIWDKKSRKIHFVCADWRKKLIRTDDDELKLEGFFPTPGPLLMTMQPGSMDPVPLYQYYRNQAEELNRVTTRLNKVLSAIRVRGAYNALLGDDMKNIFNGEDMENGLVEAKESGMLAQNGGFDRQIWLMPIDVLANVARELYGARQQIKQVIYELTGISDIIRGSSVASETATAQNLKSKWGTIRLRKMQTATANYVRDLYRLALDGATEVVPAEKWKSVTQFPLPLAAEKQQAQMQLRYEQQATQQMVALAQAQGQEPPPPKPPQPQLIQAAQSPSYEEVIAKIRSDASRTFLINVQADSTIDLDTATDKADLNEFMSSMGQLLPGLQMFAELGPQGLDAAKQILISVASRFRFGAEIADVLEKIDTQTAGQNDPKAREAAEKQMMEKEKQLADKEKQLAQQEEQMKGILTQLQDAQRALEAAKKNAAAQGKETLMQIDMAKKELDSAKQVWLVEQNTSKQIAQLEFDQRAAKLTALANKAKAAASAKEPAPR